MGITEKDILKTVTIDVPNMKEQLEAIEQEINTLDVKLDNHITNHPSGETVDLSPYQTKNDNRLKTTSKEIVPAINELFDRPSGGGAYENPFKGKIMNCLGDSITDKNYHSSKTYWEFVKETLELSVVNNYGVSGTCIARKTSTDDTAMCLRYISMSDNADIITVLGGINDLGNNIPLGTDSSTDTTTFYGALNVLCSGLITKYPNKIIFFMTPAEQSAYWTEPNTAGLTTKDYTNAMIKICGKYSIPVLDINRLSGIYPSNATNKTTFTTDGLHWNIIGHERVGKKVSDYIKYGCLATSIVIIEGTTPEELNKDIVGKTFSATNSSSAFFHFTALMQVDSDFISGAVIQMQVEGSGLNNLGTVSTISSGCEVFTDTTGILNNGAFVEKASNSITVSQTVSNGQIIINTPTRTLSKTITTTYLKIPTMIKATTGKNFSFKIDKIRIYVNGKEKKIKTVGGFFAEDTYTLL